MPDMRMMPALSIRQPWAWLVVNGHKDVENRTWPTRFRGRVYVHAGKTKEHDDFPEIRSLLEQTDIVLPDRFSLGAIVGEVDIVGCLTGSRSKWFFGPYGFLLRDPVAYAEPIPCRGMLGFFNVPETVMAPERPRLV